jgi:transcriptional regulator with XRE-family HTH domain
MTQQQLADRVGVHVVQLRRYEAGTSQPTLDVIRSMAVALGISADTLLFAPDERGPDDAAGFAKQVVPIDGVLQSRRLRHHLRHRRPRNRMYCL